MKSIYPIEKRCNQLEALHMTSVTESVSASGRALALPLCYVACSRAREVLAVAVFCSAEAKTVVSVVSADADAAERVQS